MERGVEKQGGGATQTPEHNCKFFFQFHHYAKG